MGINSPDSPEQGCYAKMYFYRLWGATVKDIFRRTKFLTFITLVANKKHVFTIFCPGLPISCFEVGFFCETRYIAAQFCIRRLRPLTQEIRIL